MKKLREYDRYDREFFALVIAVLLVIALMVAWGIQSCSTVARAEGPIVTSTPNAMSRVEARVAEIRAERAVRYAALRAASEIRIAAMLAEIEAERASWYVEHVATPTPVVVPRYAIDPVLVSPIPGEQYGNRTTVVVKDDVRSAYQRWNSDTGKREYDWWDRFIVVPTGGEVFQWTWEGTLKPDEYFQVQLICPNGSHRGTHPPTKDYFTVQGGGLRYIVQDCKGAQTRAWDHESWSPVRNIPIEWTVAIVKWDGIDPSRIGATLAEAEARWLRI